jgi:hypothetical protein
MSRFSFSFVDACITEHRSADEVGGCPLDPSRLPGSTGPG